MITRSQLLELFQQFTQLNILIVGDVMIDAYLWGKVDRISPEAPVPVIDCNKRENRLGGAGNVALNIQSMGANPILCATIGNDDKSKVLIDLMQQAGMSTQGLLVDNERPTTCKTRIISNHQQLLRVDQEITTELNNSVAAAFIKNIGNIIQTKKIDAIIFQDYDKGCITRKLIENIVKLANSNNIPTLVDPKKRHYNHYHHVSLFKPNFKELTEGLKIDLDKNNIEGIRQVALQFMESKGISHMLVTLSEHGMLLTNKNDYVHIPAEIREINDVSGAGDTVISIAGLCQAAKLPMTDTVWLANFCGGLVCEKVGVVPITPDMVLKKL